MVINHQAAVFIAVNFVCKPTATLDAHLPNVFRIPKKNVHSDSKKSKVFVFKEFLLVSVRKINNCVLFYILMQKD